MSCLNRISSVLCSFIPIFRYFGSVCPQEGEDIAGRLGKNKPHHLEFCDNTLLLTN